MSTNYRCTNCGQGTIAPRVGVGRVWSSLGVVYDLPRDLSISQCDNCWAYSPSRAEVKAIAAWLERDHSTLNQPSSSFEARVLGSFDGEERALAAPLVQWAKPRSVVVDRLAETIGGRRVEHLIEGGSRRIVTLRDGSGGRWGRHSS